MHGSLGMAMALGPVQRDSTPCRRTVPRLKSKQGCRTCVTRRKKCDEVHPVCGGCLRLGLKCVERERKDVAGQPRLTDGQNRTRGPSVPSSPQKAVSNGYPSFSNDFEKNVVAASPGIFRTLLPRFADNQYRELGILATLSLQDVMVREAIMAYSIITFSQLSPSTYTACIVAYQSCAVRLRQSWSGDTRDSDCTLVTTFFLGFLEALRLGGTGSALAHFRSCRAILVKRLKNSSWAESPLLSVYRIMAECIIFNVGFQSQFEQDREVDNGDWGDYFECLIPTNDRSLSPFLGGFLELYRIMFRADQTLRKLHRHCRSGHEADPPPTETCEALLSRLSVVEVGLVSLYYNPLKCGPTFQTEARFALTAIALKIQLLKLSHPALQASTDEVQVLVTRAMQYVRAGDICERGYHAIRWPLTVLACAADSEDDFEAITMAMHQAAPQMDYAGGRKTTATANLLCHFRQSMDGETSCEEHEFCVTGQSRGSLDLLFSLSVLDATRYDL